jgi:hypothetical protein
MNFESKLSMVAAAAALAAGGAQAAVLETFPNSGNNSSLVFLAVDSVGTRTSMLVDLSFRNKDFDPVLNAPLVGAGQSVVWNFKQDTLTVNGVAQAGTFAWSGEFAKFDAAAQTADTKFGVIAGGDTSAAVYLTTGNPTAANLVTQNSTLTTSMSFVNGLFLSNDGKGTLIAGNTAGAHAVVEDLDAGTIDLGYVPRLTNLGTNLNWQNKLSWQAMVAEGTSSVFYRLRAGQSAEIQIGGPFAGVPSDVSPYGKFNYSDGVLTWQTAAVVPEASSLAMLLAGLGAMGLLIRRRAVR